MRKKAILPYNRGECAANQKKTGPVKKEWQVGRDNDSRSPEAADGGARARTGADGAVALNLRRGPGAYALLSRADGQLTRAGQHYYSHLGLRPLARTSTTTSPSSARGPTTTSCCATGRRSSCAPCRAESTGSRASSRNKYYEYLAHVPVIIRGRRRRPPRRPAATSRS